MLHRLFARTLQPEGPQLVFVSNKQEMLGDKPNQGAVLAANPDEVIQLLGQGAFKGHVSLFPPMCNRRAMSLLDLGSPVDIWVLLAALRCGFCESDDHCTAACSQRQLALELGIIKYDSSHRLCLSDDEPIFLEIAGTKFHPGVQAMIHLTVGMLGSDIIDPRYDNIQQLIELLTRPRRGALDGCWGALTLRITNICGEEIYFPSLQTLFWPLCSYLKPIRHILGTSMRWPPEADLNNPLPNKILFCDGPCRFCGDERHMDDACTEFWVARRLGVIRQASSQTFITMSGQILDNSHRPFKNCTAVKTWAEQTFGLDAPDSKLFRNIVLAGLLLEVPWVSVWYAVMKSALYSRHDPLESLAITSCGHPSDISLTATSRYSPTLYSTESDSSLSTMVTAPSKLSVAFSENTTTIANAFRKCLDALWRTSFVLGFAKRVSVNGYLAVARKCGWDSHLSECAQEY